MIRQKVTLVLGAGASAPYGFPLGKSLMSDVIEKLIGTTGARSPNFIELLTLLGFDLGELQDFANALHDAKQSSIDAFLQERGDDFLALGKTCIAASLIPHEHLLNLKLMEHELPDTRQNERWYAYLLDLLGPQKDFGSNNLSVVTFNYDRSLEYFLFSAIKLRFNVNDSGAVDILRTVPIVHVYGQLGKPDFLDSAGRPYSSVVTAEAVRESVDEMHLMHENRNEEDVIADNRETYKLISEADRLIFTGFGYLEKNIERLMLRDNFHGEEIIACFYGKAPGEIVRDYSLLVGYTAHGIPIHSEQYDALNFLKSTHYLK